MGDTVKNFPQFTDKFDGSPLRIAIVHARWNKSVIDALVAGAVAKLKEAGVKEHNIVLQSVPGSFELPLACQRCTLAPNISGVLLTRGISRVITGSLVQAGASATDLLGGLGITTPRSATPVAGSAAAAAHVASDVDVGQKIHLDAALAFALTGLAAAAGNVE